MREKEIERKLTQETKKRGGLSLKLISPGYDGMPDRIVLLPGGRIAFVEVKAPKKRPRLLQEKRHETLRKLGFAVYVLDDPGKIPDILRQMGGENHGKDHHTNR